MSTEAFNRSEVGGTVAPSDRFVVSLVVGVADGEAASPEAAALRVLDRMRGPERAIVRWFVHDRESGETVELLQVDFDPEAMARGGPAVA